MKYAISQYRSDDRMEDLICRHYAMLLVMVRFGIPLGVGDRTIGEVCRENGVHTDTFLAVVNLLSDEENFVLDAETVSPQSLMAYLQQSHRYFLEYRLPRIRQALLEFLPVLPGKLSEAILQYFDEYSAEVSKHMTYEEEVVFPYVRALVTGNPLPDAYNIDVFRRQHDRVEEKMSELKDILLKYCPMPSSNALNSLLLDIFASSDDLEDHNRVENNLFVPAIRLRERKRR